MSAAWRAVFDIARKKRELLKLEQKMESPDFWQNQPLAKEMSGKLAILKEEILIPETLAQELKDLKDILSLKPDEQETEEAGRLIAALERKIAAEEKKIILSGKYDKNDAILTLFSGAGGDDSEDWTAMLFRMYERFADKKNWEIKILHRHANERDGIKNITFEVNGKYCYGYLKGEAGVHRLVRVSPFSAKKLRHTSFALLEVLPKIPESEAARIKDEDLKFDFARSGGPGGQNVNKRETSVRITHIPTGIQAHADTERSQAQNRQKALSLLRSKIYKYETAKKEEERAALRGKISEAAWGNQIRSYVLHPYKMVKDHRTGIETSDVEAVLDGQLDNFIEAEIT